MNNENYQIRDLPLAAFLITLGYPLLGTKTHGKSLTFHFPSTAAKAAPAYLQGKEVPARVFYASIRDLKSLIHSKLGSSPRMNMKDKVYDFRDEPQR